MTDLVVTLVGTDRPGLVQAVAEAVAAHGGNWLESRMAHLAGKFAGILRIEAPAERAGELSTALGGLESIGLKIVVETSNAVAARDSQRAMEIELLGLDQPGLVHEVSRLLAGQGINVEELITDRYSAPMSGEMMFRARARVHLPGDLDVPGLRRRIERLAGHLMVEIRLAELDSSDGGTASSI